LLPRAFAFAFAFALCAWPLPTASAEPASRSDPMAEYRARFQLGLARYQEGATAEALQLWEPLYRELGAERGWRLAFNIARAYDGSGDATRAVERYQAFLAQVEARRARGESIEALIAHEETEARDRIATLDATRGRIVLPASAVPVAVRIDGSEPRLAGFTAYVAPGAHAIVFEPGTPRETRRSVDVAAGASTSVTWEPPAPAVLPDRRAPAPAAPTKALPAGVERTIEHPFPEAVLWIAGGATLASVIVPVLTYGSASDFQASNRLSGDADALSQEGNARVRADYDAHKTTYYATLAIPATLAVATGALTTWYFLGTRVRERPALRAELGPGRASAVLRASF
jgi:hypothetical protein